MAQYEFFLASALEKVFPERRPQIMHVGNSLSCWRGQKASLQLVYTVHEGHHNMPVQQYRIAVDGAPGRVHLRPVELVPGNLPCYENSDNHYITKAPGLFPDLLAPEGSDLVLPLPRQYRSLWITFDIPADAQEGSYLISIQATPCCHVTQPNGEVFHDADAESQVFHLYFTLKIPSATLPPQQLLHTQWFHTDCLAEYYHISPFSEDYWQITARFIQDAASHGVNMLLTPVFTPPLDTPVNAERMTIQLVDVYQNGNHYTFNFQKLKRWVQICQLAGITHLEIPHLFTQWGATATPKIIAYCNGIEKRIFGWDVPANSKTYRIFLEQFIPSLRSALADMGFDRDHVYFHISDEPSVQHLDSFHTALNQTAGLLDDCPVFDALTNFEFYQKGLIHIPICANSHIQPFFDANVPNLWVYYCCVQGDRVPNRFFAMESSRNRIMGVLMYLYRVKGFLHWGYNFYHSKFSLSQIDPFRITDGNMGFPAGDPFLVYPGPGGQPLSSIRAEVQDDALLDLRGLELLDHLAGSDFTHRLITETAAMEQITFTNYPQNPDFLLTLRERVAAAIDAHLP